MELFHFFTPKLQNFIGLGLFLLVTQLANAQVSGIVFRDFNANGTKDNNTTFSEPFVAGVTIKAYDASGAEVGITTSDASGAYSFTGLMLPLRIEFSGYQTGDYTAPSGTSNSSSVQFYTAASSTANFGVNFPNDYSQPNPYLATLTYAGGNQLTGLHQDSTVLFKFPMNSAGGNLIGAGGIATDVIKLAQAKEIGSCWGMAFHKQSQQIFTAAFVKNYTGLETGGTGAIYKTDPNTGVSSLLVDINAASMTDPTRPGLFGADAAGVDPFQYGVLDSVAIAVYKRAWGDIDISEDGTKLYAMNLYNKRLYTFPIDNAATPITSSTGVVVSEPVPVFPVGFPTVRYLAEYDGMVGAWPFGLGVKDGKVYIGQKGRQSYTTTANLHIFEYNPATNTINATPVLQQDLTSSSSAEIPYNVPTDIVFDGKDMVISTRNYYADLWLTGTTNGNAFRACWDGTQWNMENNGSCGGITTAGANTVTNGIINGGEYYFGDNAPIENPDGSNGGLAQIPGYTNVVMTSYDQYQLYEGGVVWLNNQTGAADKREALILPPVLYPQDVQGKYNAIGDIEAIIDLAPLEIGNRVWNDTDGDGIQDAGETGIDGVSVQLYQGATLVGTTTTTNGGQWYFNNTNVNQNGATALLPNTAYAIRVPSASFPSGQSLSTANVGGTGQPDVRDNDATLVGGNAQISYTTGTAGQNDHTLDIGFSVPTDLSLTKTVNTSIATLNGTVIFTLTLTNDNGVDAMGVVVTDNLPAGVTFVSTSDPANATHSGGVITWNVGNMLGTDAPKTLQITVTAANEGTFVNNTEITAMNETDIDSTPNNDVAGEDDQDQACFSVPVKLCSDNASATITITSGTATSWQWYVSTDGSTYTALSGETNQDLVINNTLMGGNGITKYFKVAYNGAAITDGCGATMCCPVIVTTETCIVCPVPKCIPITITKTTPQ